MHSRLVSVLYVFLSFCCCDIGLSFVEGDGMAHQSKCQGLPNGHTYQLPNWDEKYLMMFSAKGGATEATQIFLGKEGLLEAAYDHHYFIHQYRRQVFQNIPKHAPRDPMEIARFCTNRKALCFAVVRNPFDRIVSSYIHTMKYNVFLPTISHQCKPVGLDCVLDEHNTNNCCTRSFYDKNLSFVEYLNVLQTVAQGKYPIPIPGCSKGEGGLRCASHQMEELSRMSTADQWMPQQSYQLHILQNYNAPVHYLPLECLAEGGDGLEAVKRKFGFELKSPNKESFHYVEKVKKWKPPSDVSLWNITQLTELGIPSYEHFLKQEKVSSAVCCLFMDDMKLFIHACSQSWLREKAPKCARTCARQISRIDAKCGMCRGRFDPDACKAEVAGTNLCNEPRIRDLCPSLCGTCTSPKFGDLGQVLAEH